ncbi:DNA ligase [Symbiodinium microadriaticum]|uniref:DNA ligase n=1 Tax=Symbiodinium microadriaticum TaxID=2951 RepID=A0A1Q9CLE5_SYMMI|nr:DNA ligase [Symbiodinium microadriaticum]
MGGAQAPLCSCWERQKLPTHCPYEPPRPPPPSNETAASTATAGGEDDDKVESELGTLNTFLEYRQVSQRKQRSRSMPKSMRPCRDETVIPAAAGNMEETSSDKVSRVQELPPLDDRFEPFLTPEMVSAERRWKREVIGLLAWRKDGAWLNLHLHRYLMQVIAPSGAESTFVSRLPEAPEQVVYPRQESQASFIESNAWVQKALRHEGRALNLAPSWPLEDSGFVDMGPLIPGATIPSHISHPRCEKRLRPRNLQPRRAAKYVFPKSVELAQFVAICKIYQTPQLTGQQTRVASSARARLLVKRAISINDSSEQTCSGTLLCDDASLQACTLCGGDLAPPKEFRSLNSPTCIDLEDDFTDPEPLPGEDPAQRSCEACGGALEQPTQPPRPAGYFGSGMFLHTFFGVLQLSDRGVGGRIVLSEDSDDPGMQGGASIGRASDSGASAESESRPGIGSYPKPLEQGFPQAISLAVLQDTILTNSFRVMLAMAAPAEEVSCGRVPVWQCKSNSQVESACYLFAPAKDAQAGGHRLKLASWQTSLIHLTLGRLRPDWVEGLYQELHDSGQVGAVRRTLLSLADLQGTGIEKAKTTRLVGLLRAAEGTELKWLVRTFMPHMAGVSLESSVLPALGSSGTLRIFAGLDSGAMSARLTELLNGSAAATALGVASRSGLLPVLSAVPQSSAAVAEAAGLNQRYVEEILAVLACSKVVHLSEESPPKYHVSEETQEALSGMGLYFEEMPLLTRCAFEEVVSATKQGGGVPPSCYGPFGAWMGKLADAKHEKQLVSQLLPLLAGGEIVKKLEAGTAKVLDLGCGEGTAPCLIAKHFPKAEVVGIDAWAPSVAAATKKAEAANLPNIKFVCGDAANFGDDGAWTGQFDLVTSFDVIHDLTKPDATLCECRRVLKADGYFAMVDIRAETGVAKNVAHPMAPFLYAVSLMHCMPQGMNEGGPGLGMMWGREKALSLLKGAGFEPEIIAMEFDTFNDCYLCRPVGSECATADAVRSAQEEVRHGYALRPDVRALVEALLEDGIEAPSPIMLSAEFKCPRYDGQRAQIHVLPGGRVKIFSRKLDDMTYKYPDVVKAVLKSSKTQSACVLDAEIVAVVPKENTEEGPGESKELERKDGNKVEIAVPWLHGLPITGHSEAQVKVFLFDLLFLAEEPLISLPFQQRRARLKESFAEVEDLVAYAEAEDLEGNAGSAEATLEAGEPATNAALRRSVAMSCEGLMDYVESMGDSLDLIPIGGWRGSGRKSRWVSPWLLATYDPEEGTFGSVCRVMSGFSDQFYKENTLRYLGRELHVGAKTETDAEDEGEDADEDEVEVESAESAAAEEEVERDDMPGSKGSLAGMQLRSKAGGVETLEQPQFWFDITISPKHLAAKGLVDPKRGLSLRFPRFIRKREDKRLDQATTPQQLAELFKKQLQHRGDGSTGRETPRAEVQSGQAKRGAHADLEGEERLAKARRTESVAREALVLDSSESEDVLVEKVGAQVEPELELDWSQLGDHVEDLLCGHGAAKQASRFLPGCPWCERRGQGSLEAISLLHPHPALPLSPGPASQLSEEEFSKEVQDVVKQVHGLWPLHRRLSYVCCRRQMSESACRAYVFPRRSAWMSSGSAVRISGKVDRPGTFVRTCATSAITSLRASFGRFRTEPKLHRPCCHQAVWLASARGWRSRSNRHIGVSFSTQLLAPCLAKVARHGRFYSPAVPQQRHLPMIGASAGARGCTKVLPKHFKGKLASQSKRPAEHRPVVQFKPGGQDPKRCATILQDNAAASGQRWQKDSLLRETVNQKMTELGIHAKNQDLSACARQVQWTAAIQIFHEVGKLNLQGSAGTHSAAVNACGKAKIWERALQLWAASAFRRSNIFVHGAGMGSMEKMGRWQDALAMLKHLGELRLQANVVTACTAMSSCVKGTHWRGTLLVMDRFMEHRLEPNVVMYTAAISACEFESCWKAALHLLHQLKATKVQANAHTYSAVMVACETGGQWQRALMLLSEVEQSRIEADAVIYNATISACGESGPWSAVVHLLSDMHMKQIRRDVVTFGAAIDSWKKSGCWQHAILQLAELKSIRVSPNLVIYNAAVATCEKGGAWQAALSLLSDLRQIQLREDVVTMSSLMSTCVRCTQPDQALHLFSMFTGARAEANAITYTAAIGACSRAQKWQQGLQWMTEMQIESLQYDVLLYSAAISTCETPMLWREAEQLLKDLSDRDMEKTPVTLNAAAGALGAARQWARANQLLRPLLLTRAADATTFSAAASATDGALNPSSAQLMDELSSVASRYMQEGFAA